MVSPLIVVSINPPKPTRGLDALSLADFITDWTPATPSQEHPKIETIWQLECDGAYQRDGAGASAVLTAPSGT